MRTAVLMAVAAATLLGGCITHGRRGLAAQAKYRTMSCARLDAERVKVETATNRLFLQLRRKKTFGDRSEAETLAVWPTLLFLRGPGGRDRQRYQQLAMSYEGLRTVARQQSCSLAFVSDVSKAVRSGAVDTARAAQVVGGEARSD